MADMVAKVMFVFKKTRIIKYRFRLEYVSLIVSNYKKILNFLNSVKVEGTFFMLKDIFDKKK